MPLLLQSWERMGRSKEIYNKKRKDSEEMSTELQYCKVA